MGFSSKAFKVQDILTKALQDSPALGDWFIDFGLPPKGLQEDLHIWVDEHVDEWTQESATTGLVARNEAFRLTVYLYAKRTDATAFEVREEIESAVDVLSDVVGNDPLLGGVVLYAQIVGAEYAGGFADPEGRAREGYMKINIGVDAFITA